MPEPHRCDITRIGIATWRASGTVTMNWAMEGGDFPAIDTGTGHLCGWSFDELQLIAALDQLVPGGLPLPIPGAVVGAHYQQPNPISVIEIPLDDPDSLQAPVARPGIIRLDSAASSN